MTPRKKTAIICFACIPAGLLLIFLPIPLGMDGFNGGFALAVLGILEIITCIVAGSIFLVLAGRERAILAGEGLLAHWTFTPEDWGRYTEEEHKRDVSARWGLVGVIAAIAVVIGIIFAIVNEGSGVIMFFVVVGIVAIMSLTAALTGWASYRGNRRGTGETRIATSGIYFNGQLHAWNTIGSRLERAAYREAAPGEAERPYVEVEYSAPATYNRQTYSVRVPVPPGQEETARQVVATLNAQIVSG